MLLAYSLSLLVGISIVQPVSQSIRANALKIPAGGSVRGSVRNVDWAVIPGATLVIEGANNSRRTVTDQSGNYEIELPEGIYRIAAIKCGFLMGRRAAFLLRSGAVLTINLTLTPTGATSHIASEPTKREFESIHGPGAASPLLDLAVEFDTKRETGREVEYGAAVASFDALTIRADRIVLNKGIWLLQAEDNVEVDNNGDYTRAKKVTVKFDHPVPELVVTMGAIDSVSGEGEMQDSRISFSFTVNSKGSGHLYYEDRNEGIACKAVEIKFFQVHEDERTVVSFQGVCLLNGTVHVPFFVTIQAPKATTSTQGSFRMRLVWSSTKEYDRILKVSRGSLQVHRNS